MQVKKYRARTIKEASAKVKKVLGPDAMILSTQKISKTGEDDVFEITALTGAKNISDESPNML
ncbi:MAG: protein FlhF, partial [Desulfobacterales bacterium]